MDPHFAEYLAAVAGMGDLYGDCGDDRPTEFHEVSVGPPTAIVTVGLPPAPPAGEPSEEFAGSGIWTI